MISAQTNKSSTLPHRIYIVLGEQAHSKGSTTLQNALRPAPRHSVNYFRTLEKGWKHQASRWNSTYGGGSLWLEPDKQVDSFYSRRGWSDMGARRVWKRAGLHVYGRAQGGWG